MIFSFINTQKTYLCQRYVFNLMISLFRDSCLMCSHTWFDIFLFVHIKRCDFEMVFHQNGDDVFEARAISRDKFPAFIDQSFCEFCECFWDWRLLPARKVKHFDSWKLSTAEDEEEEAPWTTCQLRASLSVPRRSSTSRGRSRWFWWCSQCQRECWQASGHGGWLLCCGCTAFHRRSGRRWMRDPRYWDHLERWDHQGSQHSTQARYKADVCPAREKSKRFDDVGVVIILKLLMFDLHEIVG